MCMYNHTRFTPAFCSISCTVQRILVYIQQANQLEGSGRTHNFADESLAYRTGRNKQATADSVQEDIDRIEA